MSAFTTKYDGPMSAGFSACTTTVWIGKITAHRPR